VVVGALFLLRPRLLEDDFGSASSSSVKDSSPSFAGGRKAVPAAILSLIIK